MQEDPVLKLDEEGVIAPAKVRCLLAGLQLGPGALNGIPTAGKHRVQRKDVDGNLSLLIEVCKLLDAEGILVFDPALEHGAATVIPSISIAVPDITESHYDTGDGASVYGEIRHVDFQHICSLVIRILRIVGELRIEDHEVLLLMGLEGNLPCPKVISCRVEKRSHISRVFQARRPR